MSQKLSPKKRHCKTCRCYKRRQKRHLCMACHARKFERFMRPVNMSNGRPRLSEFGKRRWECRDQKKCDASHDETKGTRTVNYGSGVK
jgi:hypothetical protein